MAKLKYETEDGKLFDSLEKAEKHEKRLEKQRDKLLQAIDKLTKAIYNSHFFGHTVAESGLIAEGILKDGAVLQVISEFLVDEPASGQEKM